ncbi:oligopeptide transporter [Peniophora sp. CONT]|nr:oligopeptide transporter [Peniophora sp. CONT]
MASHDAAVTLPELNEKDLPPYSPGIEKDKLDLDAEASHDDVSAALSKEPVIVDGKDVSKYVVDLRDDGDAPITFRSLVLGTLMSALTAALYQLYTFKPVETNISGVFALLIVYTLGQAWARFLPKRQWVEGTRYEHWGPYLHFLNPGPFGIKEHVCATVMASTAAWGSTAVLNFAVQRLYYDTNVQATTAVLATFSTAVFGYGIIGILRPLIIYPGEMVFWQNLPTVAVYQTLHRDTVNNSKRVKFFWIAFALMFCYEIIPSYIFPLLNGFSVICLASQGANSGALNVITNLFGGAEGNEGLGILNLSFDWQYIGSKYMSLPLTQQANRWVGYLISYIAIASIYYSNTWEAKSLPMISTSLFFPNGTRYKQASVFTGSGVSLNVTALEEIGLPEMTGSNAWYNLCMNLAIGGLFAHCVCFWGPFVRDSYSNWRHKSFDDPHYQAMLKYKEAPQWWYLILLLLGFLAGVIACAKGETTLPVWSFVVALLLGMFITPFSAMLYGLMGSAVSTNQISKMVAGAINPGKPVANLYFSMWSHDVISTAIGMAEDLKIAQYLKIPPRSMFFIQMWGTIIGVVINYVVMVSVVTSQREVLLSSSGTNIWSGQTVQSLNTNAVTWALAKYLYTPSGPYFIIPMGLFIGMVPTILQRAVAWRWPNLHLGPVHINDVILPLIWSYSATMYAGVTSVYTTITLAGILTQVYWRTRHPASFKKYNYILGGALDGGAQVMIFILSFAVFGAAGTERPFPFWAGNPEKGNVDYCNGNGALK